jgi:branched-chain amino acid transport system permease protein
MRQAEYWRALLGAIILVLVLVFPGGIVGALARAMARRDAAPGKTP